MTAGAALLAAACVFQISRPHFQKRVGIVSPSNSACIFLKIDVMKTVKSTLNHSIEIFIKKREESCVQIVFRIPGSPSAVFC